MRTYKLTIALIGTFLVIAAVTISVGYAAPVLFPLYLAEGYIALWLISISPAARGPVGAGILGAAALAIATFAYIAVRGNWNEPGKLWVLYPATGGVVLLGVNVFAIYLRHLTSNIVALLAGPALLISSTFAYYWFFNVDRTRADLYMIGADKVCAALYILLGIVLAVDRKMRSRY